MKQLSILFALAVLCINIGNAIATPIAPLNAARAEYDPATGNIKISANMVLNWVVEHLGHDSMTGDAPLGLPSGEALVVDNDTRIGEAWFSQFSADVDLGNVAATGIPNDGSLVICWNYALSPPTECFPIAFIPEPTTQILACLAGLICCNRRRQ